MGDELILVFGGGFVFVCLLLLKPGWFGWMWGGASLLKGYFTDRIYPWLPSVLPPKIATPDFPDGSILDHIVQDRNGKWLIVTEDFSIPGVGTTYGVNYRVHNDDWFALFVGLGQIDVNIDTDGHEHFGWNGIGTPEKNMIEAKIQELERENADLKLAVERTVERYNKLRYNFVELEALLDQKKSKGLSEGDDIGAQTGRVRDRLLP